MNLVWWMLHRFYLARHRRAERRAADLKKNAEKFFCRVKGFTAAVMPQDGEGRG